MSSHFYLHKTITYYCIWVKTLQSWTLCARIISYNTA